jgi:hypothetical protein
MKVDIAIHLCTDAAFQMRDVHLSRKGIREYAKTMADYLRHVADLAGVLRRDGWSLEIVKNSLVGTHPDVKTAEDATNRLIRLDILDDVTDIGEWDGRGKRPDVCSGKRKSKRRARASRYHAH